MVFMAAYILYQSYVRKLESGGASAMASDMRRVQAATKPLGSTICPQLAEILDAAAMRGEE